MNRLCCVFTTVALFAPGAASADCKGGPQDQWASVEEVKKVATDHGFSEIAKVILEDGCYEVVTINADGKIVGVHFDPITLKLEKVEEPR